MYTQCFRDVSVCLRENESTIESGNLNVNEARLSDDIVYTEPLSFELLAKMKYFACIFVSSSKNNKTVYSLFKEKS